MSTEARRPRRKHDKTPSSLYVKLGQAGWLVAVATLVIAFLVIKCRLVTFVGPYIVPSMEYSGKYLDIYSFYKWLLLCTGTAILSVIFIVNIFAASYIIKKSPANIPLALLALLLALSSLASEFPIIALYGVVDIFMGAIKFIVPLILCWLLYNLNPLPRRFQYLLGGLSIIVLVELIVTVGAFYGVLWHSVPGIKEFILESAPVGTTIRGTIMSTQNNPNYSSGIFSALSVMFFALAVTLKERNEILISCVLGCASVIIMFTQTSVSGFVTLISGCVLIGIIMLINRRTERTIYASLAFSLVIVILGGYVLNLHNGSVYSNTIGWTRSVVSALTSSNTEKSDVIYETAAELEKSSSGYDKFDLEREKRDSIDSYRFYIASGTWQLIKSKPLLGYGMDTLVYYYPVTSRETIKTFGADQYLTKPHNMYLQVAYGAGIPALLCLMWLAGAYIWSSLIYLYEAYEKQAGLPAWPTAILCFVLVFGVQGLVNDLVLGTTIMLFVLLGVGFGILADNPEVVPTKAETIIKRPAKK